MKKYIVGNWKSNKSVQDVKKWFDKFSNLYHGQKNPKLSDVTIIVCSPFVYLAYVQKLRDRYKLPVELGSQDVSPFTNGAYTGAVSAEMIAEFAKYTIIGHSERRKYFLEDDNLLSEKVKRATEKGLIPIYCVPDKDAFVPQNVPIIAYEPVWAIGSGKTESPEVADDVAKNIKVKFPESAVLYGGSVAPENIGNFRDAKNINGFLPGGASLDPQKFWEIILHASSN